jgi:hypothetical protein
MKKGILSLIEARIEEEWFGHSFPAMCPDGKGRNGGQPDLPYFLASM